MNYRGLLAADARTERPPQSSMLEVEFAQLSDRGRVREQNEDYLGYALPATPAEARTHGWLFALADGVGGQQLGEVAARAAVESLLASFRAAAGGETHSSLLPRLVQAANAHVLETGLKAGPGGAAMATTLVACALRYNRAVVAHVGDSRCYLVRSGRAHPSVDTGDLDCARMLQILEAKGFQGPAIMEIPPDARVFDHLASSFAFLEAAAGGR